MSVAANRKGEEGHCSISTNANTPISDEFSN